MKNLKNKILEKIETENIKPKSKIFFMYKNILFALTMVVSLLLSALTLSWLVFAVSNSKFLSAINLILFISIGIVSLFSFTFTGFWFFRNLKKMYKKSSATIFAIVLIFIVMVSSFFIYNQINNHFDSITASIYPDLSVRGSINKRWSQGEKGRLFGKIEESFENNRALFRDMRHGVHIIDMQLLNDHDLEKIQKDEKHMLKGFFENEIFYPIIVMDEKPLLYKLEKIQK